jgi:hypothetical protein
MTAATQAIRASTRRRCSSITGLQLGGDGEEFGAGGLTLLNLSSHGVIKEVSGGIFLWHHLIRSSSQGGGKATFDISLFWAVQKSLQHCPRMGR